MDKINFTRQKWLLTAEIMDAWRIVPRLLVIAYSYLVWDAYTWFTSLDDPNTQQAALISTLIGAAAGIFGLYTGTGRNWKESVQVWPAQDRRKSTDDGSTERASE